MNNKYNLAGELAGGWMILAPASVSTLFPGQTQNSAHLLGQPLPWVRVTGNGKRVANGYAGHDLQSANGSTFTVESPGHRKITGVAYVNVEGGMFIPLPIQNDKGASHLFRGMDFVNGDEPKKPALPTWVIPVAGLSLAGLMLYFFSKKMSTR